VIDFYDLRKVGILGQGGQATVYKVVSRRTHKVYALKVYFKRSITKKLGHFATNYSNSMQVENANEVLEKLATNEFERFNKCRHPSIMQCHAIDTDRDGNWCLLLEYAANGDLNNFYGKFEKCKKNGISLDDFSEAERHRLVGQLLDGLSHMHGKNVYHRDIKPQNLMINRKRNLLLGDFGATLEDIKVIGQQTGQYS
jgi:serine/threonine protein kinase